MPSTAFKRTSALTGTASVWSGGVPEPDVWWLTDKRNPRHAAQRRRYDYPSNPVREVAHGV
jgi:hypothetical protein